MRKISVKALRRILVDDYFHHPNEELAEAREKEFREVYLARDGTTFKKEWNARAQELRKEYAKFLITLTTKAYPEVSKEDNSSTCTLGKIALKVKGYRYGAKIDLPRVYVYGFPREFRRLIKDRQIHRMQPFEKVKYEIDVTEAGKTAKICLTLYEGSYTHNRAVTCYIKGTVMKAEVTQNGKWASMRKEVIPPDHIPKEQEYLWVMKHLSEEDNFKHHVMGVYKGSATCCGRQLDSYSASINFCPMCGCNIKEKFGEVEFNNFRITNLSPDIYFSDDVLKLVDAPYKYVTTKRVRIGVAPVY